MRTHAVFAGLLAGLVLFGVAAPLARADDPPLDDETKKALACLETSERTGGGVRRPEPSAGEKILRSPAHRAVAAALLDLLKKDPKDHATHARAFALLGRIVESHPELAPPLEALVDLAGHDDARCRTLGLEALRAVLKLKPPVPEALDARIDALLESRVEALFGQIAALAKAQKIDELIPCFQELDQVRRTYGRSGRETVQAKLKAWDTRLEEWAEIRLALALQTEITEGNEHIKAMVQAKAQERFDDVVRIFGEVEALVAKMRAQERPEFQANAGAILSRATTLRDEALGLQKIHDLKLVVSAIVLDPRPEGKNRTIVHVDGAARIYEEGEQLRDSRDLRVDGLFVVKVVEGSVKFKLGATEFVRELRAP